MRYVKVVAADDGGSKFVDVEVEQTEAPFAENVPPLLVSAPLPAQAVLLSPRWTTSATPSLTQLLAVSS